ncbi:TD and POZ domain-containing protein 5 [Caerostris darwini]|uniref:TD and POZ domain-containing protein 5 n=1 Tax=Caerostris darwini TaxID=1538125 RepID=A0AAV4W0V5_9ARAC|nr:TD and POZ domain-containing protein 5 [Caerostris darwini]
MEGRGNDGRKCCTIIWIIENFRYSCHESHGSLASPIFDFESLENTKWYLYLFPREHFLEIENVINIFVCRDVKGPKLINLDIEIVISSTNGTIYKKECLRDVCFDKDYYQHLSANIERCEIHDSNKNVFLQKDSLMVQCRMWRTDGEALKGEQFIARTVVEIERRSFIWYIKYLTSNQIFEQNSLSVTLHSKKAVLNLSPSLKDGIESEDEKFSVQITSDDESIIYFILHCHLLDSLGNKLDCGEKEFWLWNLKKGATFTLPYTHKKLIEEREKYLPNDVLSLQCDCVISTRIAYTRIESFITGIDTSSICKHDIEKYESKISPDLNANLKSMYREGTLSDTQIRTSTETFPAHSQILGARSPVFRAMFSTDMKERTTECVDITDLDSETKDSLMVQCRMWRTDGEELKGEQIIARTVVEIERRSFIWDIKYLTSNQIFKQNSLSVTLLGKKAVLRLSPFLKEGRQSVEDKFSVEITSADESIKYFTFHCDLLNSLGNKLDCGEKEFWFPNIRKGAIFKLPYTHKKLIEERAKYLKNDILSLRCDIVTSTEDTIDRIESFITGIDDNICDQNFEKYESGIFPDLKGDLKSMYREGTLSDMQIRTPTETFPAHTQILGARSPVFRAMFSTDMKERTKECVDITDLDSETVY